MTDYLSVEWTKEIVIQMLKEGNSVVCYDCDTILKYGDKCILNDGKVFCLECGRTDGELI